MRNVSHYLALAWLARLYSGRQDWLIHALAPCALSWYIYYLRFQSEVLHVDEVAGGGGADPKVTNLCYRLSPRNLSAN